MQQKTAINNQTYLHYQEINEAFNYSVLNFYKHVATFSEENMPLLKLLGLHPFLFLFQFFNSRKIASHLFSTSSTLTRGYFVLN